MTDTRIINELHEQAMELADQGLLLRKSGDTERSVAVFRQAFEYEAAAAKLVADTTIEPTRSVLHRSAATLALDCGEVREAEKLIAAALVGDPPAEIAVELRALLMEVLQTYQQGVAGR
jgi:tetratricopeptide (TPR) repeat protein